MIFNIYCTLVTIIGIYFIADALALNGYKAVTFGVVVFAFLPVFAAIWGIQ